MVEPAGPGRVTLAWWRRDATSGAGLSGPVGFATSWGGVLLRRKQQNKAAGLDTALPCVHLLCCCSAIKSLLVTLEDHISEGL